MDQKIPVQMLAKADSNKEEVYTRPLSLDEKTTISETIAGTAEEQDKLAEEIKAQQADWKERKKLLNGDMKKLLRQKRTGQVEESGRTFTFLVLEKKTAFTYDSNGEQIASRRMRAEEFQLAIPADDNRVIAMNQ